MNTNQLSYFLQVASEGSISGASRALFVSQSSLTYEIQKLEKELGFSLFDRTGRGVVLTDAGASFVETAQKALAGLEVGAEQARAIAKARHSSVIIGHHRPSSDPYFAEFISSVAEARPEVMIDLVVKTSRDLFQMVQDGSVQLAIMLQRSVENSTGVDVRETKGLNCVDLFSTGEMCIVRKDLVSDEVRALYPDDLAAFKVIFPDNQVDPSLVGWAASIDPDRIIRPESLDAALVYVRSGAGVLCVPNKLTALPRNLAQIPFESGNRVSELLVWKEDAADSLKASIADALIAFYREQRGREKR